MSKLEIRPWKETFWKILKSLKPADVCARSLAKHDNKGFYSLTCINSIVKIYPETGIIEERGNDKAVIGSSESVNHYNGIASNCSLNEVYPEYELLLLSYLINSKDIPLAGEWISEKDIPGGSMFFRGPHRLPAQELEQAFGEKPEAFLARGKELGGSEGSFGDISMQFQVLPRIPVTIVVWIGDDEFPPRCHFLFDYTIQHHLPLDVVLALTNTLVRKFVG